MSTQALCAQCSINGCDRETRSTGSPYCEKHYYRLRRTGSTADPQWIGGQCLAEGCEAQARHSGTSFKLGTFTEGYCRKHALRLRNRGDVTFQYKGENTHWWTGDCPTYEAAHQRVKKQRGVPSKHSCIDCGRPARHWSYDHSDPNELFQVGKGPYSPDVDRYHPRCVRCHKRFDLARFK